MRKFRAGAPVQHMKLSFVAGALFAATVLVACGGSGNAFQDALDRANSEEADARAAAAVSPCADVSQCGMLEFVEVSSNCASRSFVPYSLVSSSAAAASAAAAQQNLLAQQALALAPSGSACQLAILDPPPLMCTANVCGF